MGLKCIFSGHDFKDISVHEWGYLEECRRCYYARWVTGK